MSDMAKAKVWTWPQDGDLLITGMVFERQIWAFEGVIFFDDESPSKLGWVCIGEFAE